ncbi:MAG: LamG-like jellyroll fold domain-containing protein [Phycisphaerae bacterium]
MSSPHKEPSRLDQLLAAACNGNLTAEQTAELDAILLVDPDARLAYLHHLHVEAKLHRIFRSKAALAPGETTAFQTALSALVGNDTGANAAIPLKSTPEPAHDTGPSLHDAAILPALPEFDDPAATTETAPDPFLSLPPKTMSTARPSIAIGWMWPMAAVLFLTLSALVAFLLAQPRLSAATLTASIDAVWNSPPPVTGQHLPRTPLSLRSGLVHLTFDNGADVILEGPANFQVTSPTRLDLSVGQMTAHVPAPAVGFTVQTPHANVTDLGTEFGIKVSPDAQTHAEVFTGKVRAVAPDAAHPDAAAPHRTLEAGLAVNIPAAAKIEDAPPTPLAFVRPNQFNTFERDGGTSYARWRAMSDALRTDPHLLAYYATPSADPALLENLAAATLGRSDGKIHDAPWQPGRFDEKPALHFNGDDSVADINVPGKFRQLTYAAWLNVHSIDYEFTSLLTSKLAAVKITGSSRPLKPDGTPEKLPLPAGPWTNGALHLSLYQNTQNKLFIRFGLANETDPGHWVDYDFPADPIADNLDQWHFVVVSADLDAGFVRCSIDGQPLRSLHADFPLPIQIGTAEIGNRSGSIRGLNGSLDELALWNRTLTPEEIQSLYKAGQP